MKNIKKEKIHQDCLSFSLSFYSFWMDHRHFLSCKFVLKNVLGEMHLHAWSI